MKKIIFTTIIALTFTFSNAQKLKFGPKIALNFTPNLTTISDYSNNKNTIGKGGFQIGAFAELKLNERFAFQPEIMFSQQNYKIIYGTALPPNSFPSNLKMYRRDVTINGQLNYINLPLMFKFYITKGFNIELGPQIGYLVTYKELIESEIVASSSNPNSTPITFFTSEENSSKEFVNTIDSSINGGLGINLTENLELGLRYNYGFRNVFKTDGYSVINRNASLSIAYKF